MAQLPFHYYLALREDWIRSNTVAPSSDDAGSGGDDGFNLNAESLVGEAV